MAGGLSPNQLRALLQEHGSWDAVIEARPDLADQLRGVQQIAQKIGKQTAAIARMSESIRPALMRAPEQKPLLVENKIETQAAAFELALRRAREEPNGEPGRPEITITQDTLFALFERGLERARSTRKRREPSYDSIASEHGLKRTWTTPIVKWAEAHQLEARKAIFTSKTPRRFSTLVRD